MKKNIAVVAGGDSGEYGISILSGKMIEETLDKSLFNVFLIEMSHGRWIYQTPAGEVFPIDKNTFTLSLPQKTVHFDCIVPTIHGTPGEDGKLLGYFDLLHIPYTSCDVTTSALTCNKGFCNHIVRDLKIVNVANSVHLFAMPTTAGYSQIIEHVGLPCFVKPNGGGSSVNMSKVEHKTALPDAISKAFEEDKEVLVEQFIKGRELTCGLFSERGKITALPITEVISKNDFFDYEAKYNSDFHQEVTPAEIDDSLRDTIQDLSKKLYQALNCKGVVRIDFIIDQEQTPWFLEINTAPGMTSESIVPQQARADGIALHDLLSRLIQEALREY